MKLHEAYSIIENVKEIFSNSIIGTSIDAIEILQNADQNRWKTNGCKSLKPYEKDKCEKYLKSIKGKN